MVVVEQFAPKPTQFGMTRRSHQLPIPMFLTDHLPFNHHLFLPNPPMWMDRQKFLCLSTTFSMLCPTYFCLSPQFGMIGRLPSVYHPLRQDRQHNIQNISLWREDRQIYRVFFRPANLSKSDVRTCQVCQDELLCPEKNVLRKTDEVAQSATRLFHWKNIHDVFRCRCALGNL